MNKTLYYFGIALLVMSLAINVTQGVLLLFVGGPLFTLDGFSNWFWTSCTVLFATSLVILKYYHHRKFYVLFWVAVVSTIANAILQSVLWMILSGRQEFESYYSVVTFVVMSIGLVYALTLFFSEASRRIWLKRAGIYLFAVTSALLVVAAISVSSDDMVFKISLQKWIEWISLVAGLFPLFLILNFRDELKNETETAYTPGYLPGLLGGVCLVGFSLTLIFATTVASEGKMHLYWKAKNAENTAKFAALGEERTYEDNTGKKLKYLLIKPADYNPNTKYPLVVSLPYGGYEASAAQLLAEGSNRYKYPAFLFVPFCPEGAGWGGIPNYPTIDTLVFDAMLALEKEISVDTARRYVTGVSRGGYGSWHFITTRPDLFAAAIPVCGGGNPELASTITGVSVWAFHGALDRNVPVSGSRNMIEAMKQAGGNPKYTEFEDKAHNIWYEVTLTPGLWDWLFEQKRAAVSTQEL